MPRSKLKTYGPTLLAALFIATGFSHGAFAQSVGPAPSNPLDSGRGTPVNSQPAAAPLNPPATDAPRAPATTPDSATTLPAKQELSSFVPSASVVPSDDTHAAKLPLALEPKPGGLTAKSAAQRARKLSPRMRAAQARIQMAQAEQAEAKRNLWPRLDLSARYTRLSNYQAGTFPFFNTPACIGDLANCQANPDVFFQDVVLQEPILNQYALRASLTVPLSDIPLRLSKQYKASGLRAEASKLDAVVAKDTAALEAQEAFYEYLRAVGQLAVAEQSLEATQNRRDDVARFVDAGTAPRMDLLRMNAAFADMQRLVVVATNGLELAKAQLRQKLSLKPNQPLVSGEALQGNVTGPANLPSILQDAAKKRAELVSIDRQIEATDALLASTEAAQYPSVAAVGNYDYANPNPRIFPQTQTFNGTWDATLQLSWSPNQTWVSGASASKLQAQRRQLVAERDRVRDGIELEVRAAWNAVESGRSQVSAAEQNLLASEENYRVRQARLAVGSATQTELAEAETELLRARMSLVHGNVDLRIAIARLKRAIGSLD